VTSIIVYFVKCTDRNAEPEERTQPCAMSKNAEMADTALRHSAEVRDLTPESCYLRWRGPSCAVIRFALRDLYLKIHSVPRSKHSPSRL